MILAKQKIKWINKQINKLSSNATKEKKKVTTKVPEVTERGVLKRNVSRISFGRCTNWTLWNTCQPFRTSAAGNPTLSLSFEFSFSPHFFPDMRHTPCAPQRAQAGAGGWGKSANNRQQVVQKQQIVDNMCSLDLRRLHRQSKVSCHKTIN